jgi:hypothetical protein
MTPPDVLAVTQKAIAAALKVIMRADDSRRPGRG